MTGSKGALRKGGYATFQTGVPFYQPWEITEALQELERFFPRSGLYLTVVPTYIGGFMALSWATKGGKAAGHAGRHQKGPRRPTSAPSSRPTITIRKSMPRRSRCRTGSRSWCPDDAAVAVAMAGLDAAAAGVPGLRPAC